MKTKESDHKRFMKMAIKLAEKSVEKGGGPFGAVIVREGTVIAKGNNLVTLNNDPTAHGEVTAIRKACKKLGTFDLSGCIIYTSCEPCPMCLSAIYWSGITKIYYGNNAQDAEAIGFGDKFIYDEIKRPMSERSIPSINYMRPEALSAFRAWEEKEDKIEY